MAPLRLSANALAIALRVPATRIGDILREDKPRAVSADTAMRLDRYFGTTPQFWLNLQSAYDLSVVEAENGAAIERDIHPGKWQHKVTATSPRPAGRARSSARRRPPWRPGCLRRSAGSACPTA